MFLINNAYADPLGGGAGLTGELMGFLPILVMFALLYFLLNSGARLSGTSM